MKTASSVGSARHSRESRLRERLRLPLLLLLLMLMLVNEGDEEKRVYVRARVNAEKRTGVYVSRMRA